MNYIPTIYIYYTKLKFVTINHSSKIIPCFYVKSFSIYLVETGEKEYLKLKYFFLKKKSVFGRRFSLYHICT